MGFEFLLCYYISPTHNSNEHVCSLPQLCPIKEEKIAKFCRFQPEWALQWVRHICMTFFFIFSSFRNVKKAMKSRNERNKNDWKNPISFHVSDRNQFNGFTWNLNAECVGVCVPHIFCRQFTDMCFHLQSQMVVHRVIVGFILCLVREWIFCYGPFLSQ